MQKPGLTMFRPSCYIRLVPRVHPRLVVCCGFSAVVVLQRIWQWKLKKEESSFPVESSETFLAETFLRRLSPLCERICRTRLTKRSAPGVWPGATVGSVSLMGIQNLSGVAD